MYLRNSLFQEFRRTAPWPDARKACVEIASAMLTAKLVASDTQPYGIDGRAISLDRMPERILDPKLRPAAMRTAILSRPAYFHNARFTIACSGRPSTSPFTRLSFFGRSGCPAGISRPWHAFLFFLLFPLRKRQVYRKIHKFGGAEKIKFFTNHCKNLCSTGWIIYFSKFLSIYTISC